MPENWKPLEENPNYFVSDRGRVKRGANTLSIDGNRRFKDERILKFGTQTSGRYYYVNIPTTAGAKTLNVHRLVAKAFCDNPHNHKTVHHKNHNWRDNAAENLEWCSLRQNLQYAHKEGRAYRHPKGSPSPNRKLTPEQVAKIRDLRAQGLSCAKIGRTVGCSHDAAHKVITGEHYQ